MTGPWLKKSEAAEYAKVSERTLDRAVALGLLRTSTALGGSRVFNRDWLDQWLTAQADGGNLATLAPRRRRAA